MMISQLIQLFCTCGTKKCLQNVEYMYTVYKLKTILLATKRSHMFSFDPVSHPERNTNKINEKSFKVPTPFRSKQNNGRWVLFHPL